MLNFWSVVVGYQFKYSHFPSSMIMGERVSILKTNFEDPEICYTGLKKPFQLEGPVIRQGSGINVQLGDIFSLEIYIVFFFLIFFDFDM